MCDSPSILLVDDQQDFLDNMCLALEAAGYRTLLATNGVEALTVLRGCSIDLILSDIGMPQMGGYQLFKHVKQNPVWANIPFVFLTGYEYLSESEIKYGKKLGIRSYITKPIRVAELLLAVETTLGQAAPPTEVFESVQDLENTGAVALNVAGAFQFSKI